jgi:glycosyltransferase involved in cell wall biosynthesis
VRIAELSTRYPPGPGGVERHVREIATRLAARGDSVGVYTTELYREFPLERLDPSVPREETKDGVRVRRLPVFSLPGELHYPFIRGLERALERDRPEIVHAHTYGTNQVAVARRYGRRTNTPFVLTAHFHPIWSMEGGWLRRRIRAFYDRQLAGPVVARAHTVIVQSHEEERLLRELKISLPPLEIVPPGYTPLPDPGGDQDSFARSLGLPGPFLLFVGRLAANKGLAELLTAFGELAKHDPAAALVIAGADGGQGSFVDRETTRLGLTGRVHRLGFLEDERRLAAAFREARVFVLPSEYEAFGLVILEAMAQGTPVVTSRVGGIPEFVEDGTAGLLFPPGDAAALSAAILRLWDDPEARKRMGEYGRTKVVPQYGWDRVVDRLQAIYARALGR